MFTRFEATATFQYGSRYGQRKFNESAREGDNEAVIVWPALLITGLAMVTYRRPSYGYLSLA